LAVLRKIHARVPRGDLSAMKVQLPPEVALYLLNHKREDVAGLERRYKTKISILPNPSLRPHQSEIELITREGGTTALEEPRVEPTARRDAREGRAERSRHHRPETPAAAAPEEGVTAQPDSAALPPGAESRPAEGAAGESEKRRRRRRRRRRSRRGHRLGEAVNGPVAEGAAVEEA